MASKKKSTIRLPHEELEDLSNLTYLVYRRNNNQHRRSHWWKHFNIFRRQLRALLANGVIKEDTLNAATAPISSRVKLNGKGEQRATVWLHGYVARWYMSFTQVLAEQSFVALGVTLLAILGRVCMLVGVVDRLQDQAEEAPALAGRLAMHATEPLELPEEATKTSIYPDGGPGDDTGILVEREEFIQVQKVEATESEVTVDVPITTLSSKSSQKKPTKKKRSAIDDIFDLLP